MTKEIIPGPAPEKQAKKKPIKLPYFSLDIENFTDETVGMSVEEIGAYARLLMHQWRYGQVPDDDSKLVRITNSSLKAIKGIKHLFEQHTDESGSTCLKNASTEASRRHALDVIGKRRKAANSRYSKPANADANAEQEQLHNPISKLQSNLQGEQNPKPQRERQTFESPKRGDA